MSTYWIATMTDHTATVGFVPKLLKQMAASGWPIGLPRIFSMFVPIWNTITMFTTATPVRHLASTTTSLKTYPIRGSRWFRQRSRWPKEQLYVHSRLLRWYVLVHQTRLKIRASIPIDTSLKNLYIPMLHNGVRKPRTNANPDGQLVTIRRWYQVHAQLKVLRLTEQFTDNWRIISE